MEEYELPYRPSLEASHWLVLLDSAATLLPIDYVGPPSRQQANENNWVVFSTANIGYICDESSSKLLNNVARMI